jgi:hypothetical protein
MTLSTDALAVTTNIHTNIVPNRKPRNVTYGKARSYVDVSDAHHSHVKKSGGQ